jgi:peptidoglycan/xylan/chitin deacetylase (PgdA/CDA1 family)
LGINTISPKQFRRQIRFLAENGYRTHTIDDILQNRADSRKSFVITFDDGYECIYKHAFPILKEAGFKAVVFLVAGYINEWNYWDANLGGIRFRHLSTDQIGELAAAGWEIGSHGVAHRPLSYLNSTRLNYELGHSREILENIVKKDITTLSYPFGMQNSRVQKAAERAGYKFGFKNISWNGTIDNLFSIPRIPVYKLDTIRALKKKLFISSFRSERAKLSILSWPARFTPIYQILFRKQISLEK